MHKYSKLLARQRDRSIAIILDYKERACDEHLPPDVSKQLRKVVLDQLNDLTLFCEELLDSMDGSVVLNDLYLTKIAEIHDAIMSEA